MSRVPGDSPAADARPEFDAPSASPNSPVELQSRLERLPPGHPSSPYEADGSRRELAPRLQDLESALDEGAFSVDTGDDQDGRKFKFEDSAWAGHKDLVSVRRAESDRAGLSSYDQHTVDEDHEIWSADRQVAHGRIIDRIYGEAQKVPNDHKAIIAGGLCGAGKTTVLSSYAGIDRSQYLTISPDDIKEELAADGLIPEIDGLSPMEASDLVHRESSYIARQLASRAMTDGKNLIWDIQMSSRDSVKERIDNLRGAGYEQVDAIFVDIPISLSLERADARHREGEEKYRSGIGLGGRYVPPEAITSQADPEWGSNNRRAFEECKPDINNWKRFINTGDHPELVETN
jgi:predicted kinase